MKLRAQRDKACGSTAREGNVTWLNKDSTSTTTLTEQEYYILIRLLKLRAHRDKECGCTAREGSVTWLDKASISKIKLIEKKKRYKTQHTYNFYDF